ncbi:7-methylguanosine phosphate-specific 5'-nucleotidase-like isoform X1 [Tachysurus ichikawai]
MCIVLCATLQIPELNNASVRMSDRGRVETVISNMQRAEASTLQVISDFDMTLTRFAHKGKRCPTTQFYILHNTTLISEECKAKMSDLVAYYYPIQIDSSKSVEERIPHMEEWSVITPSLTLRFSLLHFISYSFNRIVTNQPLKKLEGYRSFFDMLMENSVPLLIFSVGVGDFLEEIIIGHCVFSTNMRVFSNYMDYDKDGFACSFKGELIHMFNKREGALQNIHQFVHDRTNVLLGDSLLRRYVSSYDIVLEEDETLDVPNTILNYITAGEGSQKHEETRVETPHCQKRQKCSSAKGTPAS